MQTGARPRSYSAMANAEGGLIVLGVRERKGQFDPVGIEDVAKVRMELSIT